MEYRRARAPGASFFFTVVTAGRRPFLATPGAVSILRAAIRDVMTRRPFGLDAIVVLPDHLHCIWTLPPGDADFPTRWRLIKTLFTKRRDDVRDAPGAARRRNGGRAIWQHRYWEHCLRGERDYARHMDYIHFNPVRHGLVTSPGAWPYSSFRRHVEAGLYPSDWGAQVVEREGVGRE